MAAAAPSLGEIRRSSRGKKERMKNRDTLSEPVARTQRKILLAAGPNVRERSTLSRVITPANVQIVIPVHNRRETTRICLLRLAELGVPDWAGVIVVDDGSTDGTAEMILRDHPWVHLLPADGTLWWTGAIRLGMETAIQQGAECIVWLNDDTLPDPHTLERLVEHSQRTGGVCGAVCRGDDGRPIAYAGGWLPRNWPQPLAHLGGTAPLPVHWLHGNLVAIPAAVWRRCGLPDAAHMPHNLADISYTYDAHRSGIPVDLLPSATALAKVNESASYWSWLDPRLSRADLLRGLWSVKMWWYAPGVVRFQLHHFGWRGLPALGFLFFKLSVLMVARGWFPAKAWHGLKSTFGKR